jgi:streptomycin 6-kinase
VAGPPLQLPSPFERRIREAPGVAGEAWLRELPSLVGDLVERWRLTLGPPFEFSFNYVARARRADGSEAVLKVGPWGGELVQEIRALRRYAGDGVCRLLEADEERRALLLERIRPGGLLLGLAAADDDAATRVGARLMRRLWRPVPEPAGRSQFRPLAEWFAAFARHRAAYGGPGPFPPAVLERADSLADELLGSAPTEVLLHADFHHYNVLSAEREPWLAIDPKGMIGDPGYEAGPFLLNPWLDPEGKEPALLRRRLDILADELDYDRARLRDWGIAHAVLSACWSAEDLGDGWQGAIATAQNLIDL